jgi:hypothetical protein
MINGNNKVGVLPAGEIEAALARLEALARIMDSAFVLPGTRIRLGFDALLGLIPVLGDLISQAISSYLIWEARRLGVSRLTLWRMIANSAIDTVVGAVPIAGDAFDVAFRANTRNLELLRAHLQRKGHTAAGGRERLRSPGDLAGAGRAGPVIEGTATRLG